MTLRPPRIERRRLLLGLAAAALALAAAAGIAPGAPATEPPPSSLGDRLPAGTWGVAVPQAWLAAPIADLRAGDRLDLLAIKVGERPAATAIAFDLEVMASGEHGVLLAASAFDATAIGAARAAGQLLIPLVRSSR